MFRIRVIHMSIILLFITLSLFSTEDIASSLVTSTFSFDSESGDILDLGYIDVTFDTGDYTLYAKYDDELKKSNGAVMEYTLRWYGTTDEPGNSVSIASSTADQIVTYAAATTGTAHRYYFYIEYEFPNDNLYEKEAGEYTLIDAITISVLSGHPAAPPL